VVVAEELGKVIDRLHAAGADIWTIVLVVFVLALIWKGPEYFNVIATYWNEKRRINGDLSRKLDRLHLEIAQKRDRLQARKAKKPPAKVGRGQ
jgi:hypothetical protein